MKSKKLLIVLGNVLMVVAMTCLTFCKKEKKDPAPSTGGTTTPPEPTTEVASGLPSSKTAINAYLYASYEFNYSTPTQASKTIYAFAVFGDPARNLMTNYNRQWDYPVNSGKSNDYGNVTMPGVNFSGYNLIKGTSATATDIMTVVYGTTLNYSTRWLTTGATGFETVDLQVTRGFPMFSERLTTDTLRLNKDFKINLSTYVSNYDSLTVYLSNSPSRFGSGVKKTIRKSNEITFTSSELIGLYSSSSAYIYFRAYNYSNKRQNNKTYLLELSSKERRRLVITN